MATKFMAFPEELLMHLMEIKKSPVKSAILSIIRSSDKPINLRKIHSLLSKEGIKIAYQNVAENINDLVEMRIVSFEYKRTKVGREKMVEFNNIPFLDQWEMNLYANGRISLNDLPSDLNVLYMISLYLLFPERYTLEMSLSPKREKEVAPAAKEMLKGWEDLVNKAKERHKK